MAHPTITQYDTRTDLLLSSNEEDHAQCQVDIVKSQLYGNFVWKYTGEVTSDDFHQTNMHQWYSIRKHQIEQLGNSGHCLSGNPLCHVILHG